MVECKAHKGASIPFAAIPQYDRMLKYKNLLKTHIGVLIWFYEKDTVIWVSIETMEQMINDKEKSIGLRMLQENYKKDYDIIVIPSVKLRTFMDSDYIYLMNQLEARYNERFK